MISNTHLLISKILYKYLSNEMNFKLDRLAFTYGNIKPDFINEDIKCLHTLDGSLYCVNKYSEKLMRENISIRKFSIYLGIICHYVCDYFCIFHREGNEKKGIFGHLFYELILHIRFLILLLRGKLILNNCEMIGNSVEVIILKLQDKYNSEEKCLTRDINNALLAAVQISKLVVYSSQLYFEKKETNMLEEYLLS